MYSYLCFFDDAVRISDSGKGFERMWNEAVVAKSGVLIRNLPGGKAMTNLCQDSRTPAEIWTQEQSIRGRNATYSNLYVWSYPGLGRFPNYSRSQLKFLWTREKSELLGSWTYSIVPYSKNYKTQCFGNWTCFRPQVRRETLTLPLERANFKGPNRVGVSPSPEDGNRSSFRNIVFSSFQNNGK
jgi:hypothetical protein